jgi:arsenate reductase (glutaredoxin)
VPAPLGNTTTKKMPKIDVLGVEDSAATRSAVRFFRERRIVVRYLDLRKRPIELAELRAILDRLGARALVEGEIPSDRGAFLARLRTDPQLLRLPLVRYGNEVTAGSEEATWKLWLARRSGGVR